MSSDYEHKNYQRNNRGDRDSNRKEPSPNVIRDLIKSGKSDFSVLASLRSKYSDQDMIDAIFDGYKDRLDFIMKKARKFKQLMFDRYSRYNITVPQLMKKARKYKDRYELNEDEFEIFKNFALNDEKFSPNVVNLPHTAMSKTLGYAAAVAETDRLRVNPNEMDVLQEILRINAETRPLHSSVTLQSLMYGDMASEALAGKFNAEKNNPYSYVHPVVAALFLPKVQYLDEHMLIANISNIVKCKHEGRNINTKPDYEVYWDLITDPNDTVCDMSSPLRDLKNRIILQTRLWDSVINLRQGKYYNDRLVEFLLAIDNCRNNIYDVPDLTYVKDEGAIVRRLLSAFSLRPTIVSTTPLYGIISNNPYINATSVTQVTTVPMITLRLPINAFNRGATAPVKLESAITQAQWFVDNKMLVPKSQNIMYSRDVIFFYVNRRYQTVNISRLNAPYNFNNLPMTVAGLEKLNDREVDYQDTLKIGGDDAFLLKSVVAVNTHQYSVPGSTDKQTIITGTRAIMKDGNGRFVVYDPQSVATADTSGIRPAPIQYADTTTSGTTGVATGGDALAQQIRTAGTVFMYVKAN